MPSSTSPSGDGVGGVDDRLDVQVGRVGRVVDRGGEALADRPSTRPARRRGGTSGGRSRCRASGTRSAASSRTVAIPLVPADEVVLERSSPSGCPAATRRASPRCAATYGLAVTRRGDRAELVPPPAVGVLVDVEVGRQRREVHRGPQPEELRVAGGCAERRGLAHRADAPGAVARRPGVRGRHVDALAVEVDPPGPRAELGEPGVVEEHPLTVALEEVRFLERRRAAVERQLGAHALVGRVDHDAQRAQRLDHLDPDRPDAGGVAPVLRRPPRGVDAGLRRRPTPSSPVTTQNAASTTWRLGYRPIARAKYSSPSRGHAVEEVAVVVVGVTRGGERDRHARLVQREVVVAGRARPAR